jgi:hypothetical protein
MSADTATQGREANEALRSFDPLLVQLVLDDAPRAAITAEGFSLYDLYAVRTLAKRAGHMLNVPAGESIRSRAVVTGPLST